MLTSRYYLIFFYFTFFPLFLSLSLYFAVLSMKELCQFARKIEAVCLSCRTNFIYVEIFIIHIYIYEYNFGARFVSFNGKLSLFGFILLY